MASVMKRPRLAAVETLPGYRLCMTFIDGNVMELDMTPLFEESPGLVPLRDPAIFAGA